MSKERERGRGTSEPLIVDSALFSQILARLKKHEDAVVFLKPVDWQKMGLDDYPTIVTEPMDFQTLGRRVRDSEFAGPGGTAEFLRKLELIWNNCRLYNGDDSDIAQMANRMEAFSHILIHDLLPSKYHTKAVLASVEAAGAAERAAADAKAAAEVKARARAAAEEAAAAEAAAAEAAAAEAAAAAANAGNGDGRSHRRGRPRKQRPEASTAEASHAELSRGGGGGGAGAQSAAEAGRPKGQDSRTKSPHLMSPQASASPDMFTLDPADPLRSSKAAELARLHTHSGTHTHTHGTAGDRDRGPLGGGPLGAGTLGGGSGMGDHSLGMGMDEGQLTFAAEGRSEEAVAEIFTEFVLGIQALQPENCAKAVAVLHRESGESLPESTTVLTDDSHLTLHVSKISVEDVSRFNSLIKAYRLHQALNAS